MDPSKDALNEIKRNELIRNNMIDEPPKDNFPSFMNV